MLDLGIACALAGNGEVPGSGSDSAIFFQPRHQLADIEGDRCGPRAGSASPATFIERAPRLREQLLLKASLVSEQEIDGAAARPPAPWPRSRRDQLLPRRASAPLAGRVSSSVAALPLIEWNLRKIESHSAEGTASRACSSDDNSDTRASRADPPDSATNSAR